MSLQRNVAGSLMHVKFTGEMVFMDRGVAGADQLSIEAKGLLVWLLAEPTGFDFNIEGLSRRLGLSKARVRAAAAPLMTLGYITRKPAIEKGRYMGWDYTFHPTPLNQQVDDLRVEALLDKGL